jgi:hypothetical protein
MEITPAYLNLKQSAQYLNIAESTAKKIWPSWIDKYGVIPSRYPSRTLKFKVSDLDKIMDAEKVVREN